MEKGEFPEHMSFKLFSLATKIWRYEDLYILELVSCMSFHSPQIESFFPENCSTRKFA